MKFLYALFFMVSLHGCNTQKEATINNDNSSSVDSTQVQTQSANSSYAKIKMGSLTPLGNKMIKLKKVTNDSRCPEGTQCIWAGEATVIVGLYDESNLIKDITVTFSPKDTTEDNPAFLFKDEDTSYYAIGLSPYPKSGSKIEAKNYTLTVSIK